MNKFGKVLLLALIFAAPVTVFTSVAQAKTIHTGSVKAGKYHKYHNHKHHMHHAKKPIQR
ncbi:MAG: hypothetical protein V7L29_31525 [Nostoc sp.]|uniref:hypothetical protein n=1 Tax=Nostoc sp. TaxID=1180 RepID=UPI002FF880DD